MALGLLIFAGGISAMVQAQDSGFYAGGNIGQSQASIDTNSIAAGLFNQGYSLNTYADDERGVGFKLFGGYQFNENFALEGGYFNLGQFDFATTTPAGTYAGEIKLDGLNIDAVFKLPVTERLSLFGRAGASYVQSKDSFNSTGSVSVIDPNPKDRDTNYKYGVGMQYDLTRSLSVRTEAERYRVSDAIGATGDVDLLSVGLVYTFGAKAAPAKVESKPVAVNPAPVPKPVVVIVPVTTEQYCSILDIEFAIAVDNLQRDDEEKLAVLGTFMNKYKDTTAVIEGHTDSVGSDEESMKLSKRRAESVVAYLVKNAGISSSRLKAVGYGATRPIADNRSETGKRRNRRINAVIACATDIEGLTVRPARLTMALQMEFDTNKATVRPTYRDDLARVARFMKANPKVTATVEGHTSDQQGPPSKDMTLSQHRAENVVDYLVKEFGVDRTRLTAVGFGNSRRVAYNTSIEGQQENRRVNIIFDFPDR